MPKPYAKFLAPAGLVLALSMVAAGAVYALAPGDDRLGADPIMNTHPKCVESPVVNVEVVNASTVKIEDRRGLVATLKLSGTCLRDSNATVGIDIANGLHSICKASDVDIIGNAGSTVPLRCSVKSMSIDAG